LTTKQNIKQEIFSAVNVKQVEEKMNLSNDWLVNFNKEFSLVYNTCATKFRNKLLSLVKEVFNNFEETFEAQYPLKRITDYSIDIKDEALDYYISEIMLNVANIEVSNAVSQGKAATGVGTGAGALIGTILFPGVGTVMGGIAGYFIGSLFGPSLQEVQKKAYSTISDLIDDFLFTKVYPDIKEMILSKQNELDEIVMKVIKEYLKRYETIVNDLINEHKENEKLLEVYIRSSDYIIKDLKDRIASMEELHRNLLNTNNLSEVNPYKNN
jgi:5-methylthioribose kinase